MCSDLEDRIGRGIDDRKARAHVLFAQLLDDLGARSHRVAERFASDSRLEGLADFGRDALGEGRQRFLQDHAGDFPVSGRGVLALGPRRRLAPSAARRRHRGHAADRDDPPEAQSLHHWHRQPDGVADVAECVRSEVAALLAVLAGIGHEADPGAVEDDDEDPADRADASVSGRRCVHFSSLP